MKFRAIMGALCAAGLMCGVATAQAAESVEVLHWWTSGGESAAIRQFADAYNQAGGQWVDNAVAGADQARATAINRIVGGDPPTAAQFNTSKQFHDLIDQGLLNNVDAVGVGWGAWTMTHPGYLQEQWAELEPLLASGAVPAPQPVVYPLEQAGEAIASLENRTARGKVVVAVR
jgi:ABC-type glycerol-3-phosphate transport system substrate-binding protein